MLQRLSIALAQVKAGSASKKLDELRQYIYIYIYIYLYIYIYIYILCIDKNKLLKKCTII